ncbi:4-methylaminobutanoate oxidase (formaldehyde-forming) [Roseovarius albus]|uniref:4-methylaminobutanoate oxidase (Formaldehyde-forming) n=1 Tax=Roseovarius albus TaxID=1247867 RepID=A0A1X7A4W6_9RHOB|nr:FAD-dependent oxidoreductase [Roseovarius albus]SLN70256.1 4-methylaminobutanoate oxidase (formaldehyde-forming) [Roseovarius albus]
MSNFPSTARVVIIGGGVVGTSTLYHLAKAGWTDCVMLEKNELTAGSTWHAAGNVPNFAGSWAVMNMQRYSAAMYRTLGEDVDYPMNYHVTGAIRLAHNKERMQEFERVAGMGRYQGLQMDICTPEELKAYNPFIETHDLEGGLWDPLDGDIDPAQLTQALAKGARDAGGRIERFCSATGIERDGDEWIVKTEKGDIRCEYVANCAGYYAQRVGEMFKPFGGRTVPMVVMSHQYFLTDEIPELAEWTKENGQKMPMIRDVDTSYYLRQDKNGLNLGPYERNCKAHWITPEDPMPHDFSFQLFPDDLERLEWYIEDAMERLPLLGTAGVGRNINGPIPYAPDGLPMIGPMPGVKNAFEAHSFTFGIAQGGGAGKVLSEWIMHGETELDMWAVDPRRYTDYADHDYCLSKALETYGHEYAMHFPHHEWPAGRDKKLSANHERLLADGGQMGAYNGWERANWFAKEGDDTSEAATETWDRNGPWAIRVKEEVEACRDNVAVLDMPGFSRYTLKGEGAAEWLRGQVAGALPKAGRMNLGYFADSRGKIITEVTIIRFGEDDFMLMTAAVAQWHDYEFLLKSLPSDGSLTLTDVTRDWSTLLVAGPSSRDLLSQLTDADLTTGWLTHQDATFAGKPAKLMRICFGGELGWEIHTSFEDSAAAYEAVRDAGATPFGMYALDSMRIEKGYRTWKGDLSSDYSLLEGGLERFIRLNKEQNFPGKAALQAEKQAGSKKAFVTLIVESDDADAPYMSTIWDGDEVVGETTSGNWGYRVNASIALGVVRSDKAAPGTELEVEIYGKRCRAIVQKDEPLWDPSNERITA